jgi:hypothetical protein
LVDGVDRCSSPALSRGLRGRWKASSILPVLRERLGMRGNGQKKLLAFGKTHQSVWIFFAKGIDTGGDGGIIPTTGPLRGFAEQKQKIELQNPSCRGRPSLERHKGSVPAEPETKQEQEVISDDFQTSV